jgi:hypothetical protein
VTINDLEKNDMEDLLSDFRQTIETASLRLLHISEEQSATPKAQGKWSPKQIIGHLIDSASNNHQRFVRAQFTDDLVFPSYQQEEWVRAQRYDQEPWEQLVQLWKHYNKHLLHLMSVVPEEVRTRLRDKHNLPQTAWQTVAENHPVTLEYFMRDYVEHLKNHLRQILRTV